MLESSFSFLAIGPLWIAWLGCFWLFRELAARQHLGPDWRLSWVLATILWGSGLTLIVEASSWWGMTNPPTLRALWICADVVLVSIPFHLAKKRGALAWSAGRETFRGWWREIRSWPVDSKFLFGVSAFLAGSLLVLAVATPTTNYDSLSYHLPRIFHWMQQQSVEHFATNDQRQIQYGPWSSFVMLNFHLLSGNDRLFNGVQWGAMFSTLVALSWVAGRLLRLTDANVETTVVRRVEAWTCLLIVTLPTGLVQSITTQNDYVVAFWASSLFLLGLELWREPASRLVIGSAGLACGLGILTKATIFIYVAPLVILAGGFLLRRSANHRTRLQQAGLFCAGVFLVSAPHLGRNYELYGHPLGSQREFSIQQNARLTVSGTYANIIRNLALNTNTGIPPVTRALNRILAELYWLTGRDLNDPEISYYVGRCFFLEEFRLYDSYASNPYHLLLIVVGLGLAWKKRRQNAALLLYSVLIAGSFLLFCAYLRYQMWHTRFHLAYFVLLLPTTAVMLVQCFPRRLAQGTAVFLSFLGLFYLVSNESRPILSPEFRQRPREEQYLFVHAPFLSTEFQQAAASILAGGCQSVGLKLSRHELEYPLWLALQSRGFTGEIHHVFVENESAGKGSVAPCVVLADDGRNPPKAAMTNFPQMESFGHHTLFWPERTGFNLHPGMEAPRRKAAELK